MVLLTRKNFLDGLMSILSKGLLGRVFSSDLEDAGSSGYGVQDVNSSLIRGNLPLTSRIILDVNRVSYNREAELLSESAYFRRAVQQRSYGDKVVDVIRRSNLLSDYYEFFFPAAFPTLFPYGTDKHIHSLRQHPLNLKAWTYLLLRPSSTYIIEDKVLLKWYRRCQGHAHFVGLVFDFLRRRKSSTFRIKPNARPGIKQKISSKRSQLATLKNAATLPRDQNRVDNSRVRTLLNSVSRASTDIDASDERKSHLLIHPTFSYISNTINRILWLSD